MKLTHHYFMIIIYIGLIKIELDWVEYYISFLRNIWMEIVEINADCVNIRCYIGHK